MRTRNTVEKLYSNTLFVPVYNALDICVGKKKIYIYAHIKKRMRILNIYTYGYMRGDKNVSSIPFK